MAHFSQCSPCPRLLLGAGTSDYGNFTEQLFSTFLTL